MSTTPPVLPDRRRGAWSSRVVLGLFAASIVLAMVGAGALYFGYLRYERAAARHLPRDTELAFRVDLEKVVLFEPFRRHLLPLFEELGKRPGSKLRQRIERLEHHTGIELGVDLREVVLARRGPGQWLALLGGLFRDDGVLAGVAATAGEEGVTCSLSPDQTVLGCPGLWVGRAADGVFVLASSEASVRGALTPSDVYVRLGLPLEGPGGFAVGAGPLRALSKSPDARQAPFPLLVNVTSLRGNLELGQPVTVRARATLARAVSGDAKRAQADRLVSTLRGVAAEFGLAELAASVEASSPGGGEIGLTGRWDLADIDRAAARVASLLASGASGAVSMP